MADEQDNKSSLRGRGRDIMRGPNSDNPQSQTGGWLPDSAPSAEDQPYFADDEAVLKWMDVDPEQHRPTVIPGRKSADSSSMDTGTLYPDPDFDAIFGAEEDEDEPAQPVAPPVPQPVMTEKRASQSLEDIFVPEAPQFDAIFSELMPGGEPVVTLADADDLPLPQTDELFAEVENVIYEDEGVAPSYERDTQFELAPVQPIENAANLRDELTTNYDYAALGLPPAETLMAQTDDEPTWAEVDEEPATSDSVPFSEPPAEWDAAPEADITEEYEATWHAESDVIATYADEPGYLQEDDEEIPEAPPVWEMDEPEDIPQPTYAALPEDGEDIPEAPPVWEMDEPEDIPQPTYAALPEDDENSPEALWEGEPEFAALQEADGEMLETPPVWEPVYDSEEPTLLIQDEQPIINPQDMIDDRTAPLDLASLSSAHQQKIADFLEEPSFSDLPAEEASQYEDERETHFGMRSVSGQPVINARNFNDDMTSQLNYTEELEAAQALLAQSAYSEDANLAGLGESPDEFERGTTAVEDLSPDDIAEIDYNDSTQPNETTEPLEVQDKYSTIVDDGMSLAEEIPPQTEAKFVTQAYDWDADDDMEDATAILSERFEDARKVTTAHLPALDLLEEMSGEIAPDEYVQGDWEDEPEPAYHPADTGSEVEAFVQQLEQEASVRPNLPPVAEMPAPPTYYSAADEAIPLVEAITRPIDVGAMAVSYRAVDKLNPPEPEVLPGGQELDYFEEEDAVVAPIPEKAPPKSEDTALATTAEERPRDGGVSILQPGTPDRELLGLFVDDNRLRELFEQIEAVQEDVVQHGRGNSDVYLEELLYASNLLLSSRENYDEARAAVYRVRADLTRERRLATDIEKQRPVLAIFYAVMLVIIITLALLSGLFVGLAETVGIGWLGQGYYAAIAGLAGAWLRGAYMVIYRYTILAREFDPTDLNWWYFINPLLALGAGYLVYLFLAAATWGSGSLDAIATSPVTLIVAAAVGLSLDVILKLFTTARQPNDDAPRPRQNS